ncbi:MAG: prepilin-type N-terminal cleavage/methylation domain-containing protein [Kiritimatiellaeota bacterium]|nr:prepilin-type N-terminal cleavage/methylation domain-containing protein [Kiritimatiellota bacterium]
MKRDLKNQPTALGLPPSAFSSQPSAFRRGFTLIELLAAMTVLALILLMLGQVFSGSTKAWESGTRRMDQNISARAVLDFIARDLSGAIMVNFSNSTPHTAPRFLTLAETPDGTHREGRIVEYTTNPSHQLMRTVATAVATINSAYTGGLGSGGGSGAVAANVAAFDVTGYGSSNGLPRYVDIFMSVLSDADAQRPGVWAAPEKYEKRYTTRVFLQNQKGYAEQYP